MTRAAARCGVGALVWLVVAAASSSQALGYSRAADERPHSSAGLKPGDVVKGDGIWVRAPRRGGVAWGHVHFTDGTWQTLQVLTLKDGRIVSRYSRGGMPESPRPTPVGAGEAETSTGATVTALAPTSSTDECQDGSFSLYSWRMPVYSWRFQPGSVPSNIRTRANGALLALHAVQRAGFDIETARNSCGRPDNVSAVSRYLGDTTRGTNVARSAGCPGGDGYSVIGWGSLPAGVVGMACVYGTSLSIAREGDIRLSWGVAWETERRWCDAEYLIEPAVAHEMGHVYGLAHVSNSALTMSRSLRRCDDSHSTLGLGDLRGLERHY